jgi:serine/threonine protein kinase
VSQLHRHATFVGETIGNYLIEGVLGSGGMGKVFLAVHRRLRRRVAIKLLSPQHSGSADMLARFFKEARASSLIEHPGIVSILDCDVHSSGRAFIVMEYLHGESLRHALDRARRLGGDFRSIVEIATQLAEALDAAHRKNIVHRDLKPDNAFLVFPEAPDREPLVKILDFGIAKLLGDDADPMSRTRTGSLLGTPLYMSPEQCASAATVDHRSDIYSLGCIYYEMACGRPPFVSERITDLLIAHASRPVPTPAAIGVHDVPAALEALVMAMLAKEPERRPQTMAEVAAALKALDVARSGPRFQVEVAPPTGEEANPLFASELRTFENRHESMRLEDTAAMPAAMIAPTGRWSRRSAIVASAALVLVLATMVAPRWWRRATPLAVPRRPGIVVVPVAGPSPPSRLPAEAPRPAEPSSAALQDAPAERPRKEKPRRPRRSRPATKKVIDVITDI